MEPIVRRDPGIVGSMACAASPGRFVFDVFNPSVRLLAEADGVGRTRESLSFMDPDRGTVSVPPELPLLVSLGGLKIVERFGDWSGRPFAADSPLQLCVCESA